MNVPKLRFKEFTDEWVTCTINSVAEVISGGTPDTTNSNYWDGSINWFTPSEVGKSKYISNSKRKITQLGLQKSSAKLLPVGTILLSSRATVGESSILYNNEACTNQGFQSLISHKNINNEFLYYLIYKYKKSLLKQAFGSTFLEISKNNVEKIKINIPTAMKEQVKLSTFLSLLDRKIELQTKKIEVLKLFKLSIKKKIFQTNINTEIKLNQLVKCESSSLTLSDIQNIDGPFPVYGAEGFIKNINFYNHNNEYIAIVKDGAGVGRTMICPSKSSTISTMNALIPILEYKATYILELLNLINFKKYIIGSGIPHIYFKDYGKEKIKIHSIDKSNKITKLFDLLNKRINYTQNQVEHLKKLKQGLLQIMFI